MRKEDLILIPSRSGGQNHQVVILENGNIVCTCPAHKYGKECWAVKKVRANRKVKSLLLERKNYA